MTSLFCNGDYNYSCSTPIRREKDNILYERNNNIENLNAWQLRKQKEKICDKDKSAASLTNITEPVSRNLSSIENPRKQNITNDTRNDSFINTYSSYISSKDYSIKSANDKNQVRNLYENDTMSMFSSSTSIIDDDEHLDLMISIDEKSSKHGLISANHIYPQSVSTHNESNTHLREPPQFGFSRYSSENDTDITLPSNKSTDYDFECRRRGVDIPSNKSTDYDFECRRRGVDIQSISEKVNDWIKNKINVDSQKSYENDHRHNSLKEEIIRKYRERTVKVIIDEDNKVQFINKSNVSSKKYSRTNVLSEEKENVSNRDSHYASRHTTNKSVSFKENDSVFAQMQAIMDENNYFRSHLPYAPYEEDYYKLREQLLDYGEDLDEYLQQVKETNRENRENDIKKDKYILHLKNMLVDHTEIFIDVYKQRRDHHFNE